MFTLYHYLVGQFSSTFAQQVMFVIQPNVYTDSLRERFPYTVFCSSSTGCFFNKEQFAVVKIEGATRRKLSALACVPRLCSIGSFTSAQLQHTKL